MCLLHGKHRIYTEKPITKAHQASQRPSHWPDLRLTHLIQVTTLPTHSGRHEELRECGAVNTGVRSVSVLRRRGRTHGLQGGAENTGKVSSFCSNFREEKLSKWRCLCPCKRLNSRTCALLWATIFAENYSKIIRDLWSTNWKRFGESKILFAKPGKLGLKVCKIFVPEKGTGWQSSLTLKDGSLLSQVYWPLLFVFNSRNRCHGLQIRCQI